MAEARHHWIWVVMLGVVVAAGASIRLVDLEKRTMGHSEVYVPGVDLPVDWGEPRGRLTLKRTITNSMWEPHPPGWYAGMWAYTKVFGTGLFTVRFPSVLCGVACILLVYRLGRLDGDRRAAIAAAALLALNGHQVYWSQVARPSTMMCLLGLVATWLLLRVSRSDVPRRGDLLAYGAVGVTGLVLDYYFWVLFAVHILWALLGNWREKRRAVGMFRVQMFVVALASPAVTLAVFQSRPAHFEHEFLESLRDFFEIGFLFTSKSPVPHAVPAAAELVLPPVGIALFVLGLIRRGTATSSGPSTVRGPSILQFAGVALLVIGAIVGATLLGFRNFAPAKTTVLLGTAALPAIAFACAALFRSESSPFVRIVDALFGRWLGARSYPLVSTMAVLPPALIVAANVVFPLFVARHMLIFVPYYLLAVGGGIVWIVSRARGPLARAGAAALLLLVLVAHVASIRWYSDRLHSPEDYDALATAWAPELKPDDIVLVRDHWSATPILYYIDHRTHRFVWRDHATALQRDPEARVWNLHPASVPVPDDVLEALAGYRLERSIEARGIAVRLYLPATTAP